MPKEKSCFVDIMLVIRDSRGTYKLDSRKAHNQQNSTLNPVDIPVIVSVAKYNENKQKHYIKKQ